tara:strand:+ start:843 stop:1346 length:504 start_codon:yes stop_codon:yes gene_type:complete
MALWGKSDSLFSTGTIAVNLTTKVATVSAGTLPAAATLEGAVVTITGKGSATIKERTGNRTFVIHNTTGLDGTAISGVAYNISEQPKSTVLDTNYSGDEIFGVDTTEQSVANAASGDARKYAPAHAGWVGISTYIDMHGNLRVKTETLVAGSSITGDAADDTKYADS